MASISVYVPGIAKPAGSKKAMWRPGMKYPSVVDACDKSKDWKAIVAWTVKQQLPPGFQLFQCPLHVTFKFVRMRPKGHFNGKGALNKKGAEAQFPTQKPDLLKTARGVEDALTGIVYTDDSLIVRETLWKDYGDKPGVFIEIGEMK